jgi:diaminopimelate epimerase
MKIRFQKYQATGNDFILIDNRAKNITLNNDQIRRICDRHFGVGGDGLILIEPDTELPFNVNYFNSDGTQSLCGNGSRAAVVFASSLGMVNGKADFRAFDGQHEAQLLPSGIVRLRMNRVEGTTPVGSDYFIYTGSPHYIRFVDQIDQVAVVDEGRIVRYDPRFAPGGVNVNFVQILNGNSIFVRTYERGVENETLSCGTGVTAAALASSLKGLTSPVHVKTLGGELSVEFKSGQAGLPSGQAGTFDDIFLIGPAKMVFEGEMEL